MAELVQLTDEFTQKPRNPQQFYRGGSLATFANDKSRGFQTKWQLGRGRYPDVGDTYYWISTDPHTALIAAIARSDITQTPPVLVSFSLTPSLLMQHGGSLWSGEPMIHRPWEIWVDEATRLPRWEGNYILSSLPINDPQLNLEITAGAHPVTLPTNLGIKDGLDGEDKALAIFRKLSNKSKEELLAIVGQLDPLSL